MLSVGYKRIKGNSKMEEIVKNCLNIIREQKEKINFLEVQNSQLNTLLETQTKLLMELVSFYRGEASKFIPDVNYEKLFNYLQDVPFVTETLQLIHMLNLKKR